MNSFEELDVWKTSRIFKSEIRKLAKAFPITEKYNLTSQILRSSRSITANIAEGYGRFHFGENVQFCRQARGSLTETLDHLIEALDSEYISQSEFDKFRINYEQCLRLLNGYIAYLNRQKSLSKI